MENGVQSIHRDLIKIFGSKIDPDFLEELWDDEFGSRLTINKLKETGDVEELSEEIFLYIDGILMVKENDKKFNVMPHKVKSLSNFLLYGRENDFIEIVECEDE